MAVSWGDRVDGGVEGEPRLAAQIIPKRKGKHTFLSVGGQVIYEEKNKWRAEKKDMSPMPPAGTSDKIRNDAK